jgi:hypothetical protein
MYYATLRCGFALLILTWVSGATQLASILGDEFDATVAKNFAKVADEIILVKKADDTVDEFFEAFFRSFTGNPSELAHADSQMYTKILLPDQGKAALKSFLGDPNPGKLWDTFEETTFFNNRARGVLGELSIYKRVYKNAGYEHFPTATAFDLKSAAEYVQIKTLKNPDGAYGAMKKAVDDLAGLPNPPNELLLHILKKPGAASDQLKAALQDYIEPVPKK